MWYRFSESACRTWQYIDDLKDIFYEELEQVFDYFSKLPNKNCVTIFYLKTGERIFFNENENLQEKRHS